jgi:hypothetical protein
LDYIIRKWYIRERLFMARLHSIPPFLGTIDGICVYTRWGKYYMRTKSSLSGERVKKAPEFKKTMENASLLSRASKIASVVYRQLAEKKFSLYRMLTGQAMKMLKAGRDEENVRQDLMGKYL